MARMNHSSDYSNDGSKRVTFRRQIGQDPAKHKRHQHRAPPKRSVNSLSTTQLERKRANDREAQRLIRQRTKERIEGLEKQIVDLSNENQRLNRCLKQKIDGLRKGIGFDAESTPWSCCAAMNLSRCRHAAPPSESSTYGLFAVCLTGHRQY